MITVESALEEAKLEQRVAFAKSIANRILELEKQNAIEDQKIARRNKEIDSLKNVDLDDPTQYIFNEDIIRRSY